MRYVIEATDATDAIHKAVYAAAEGSLEPPRFVVMSPEHYGRYCLEQTPLRGPSAEFPREVSTAFGELPIVLAPVVAVCVSFDAPHHYRRGAF